MCSAGFPHYRHSDKSILSSGKPPGFSFCPRRTLLCPTSPNDRAAVQAVPGYHRDAIHITSARTQTYGRCVLVIHRRYKEQNTTSSHVPATPTRTNAVTGHEVLAYLQLPCICSYVPEILFSLNTSNIRGIMPA